MKAGVLALQGAVSEHFEAFEAAFRLLRVDGTSIEVRTPDELDSVDVLAIPGGESTTISRLLERNCLRPHLARRWKKGMPILGTCAGAIMLAKRGDEQVSRTDTHLLGFIDARVDRNAFGRQRDSFERLLDIEGFDRPYPGIFIRAPAITEVWGDCRVRAILDGRIVMVQQGNVLATSFHPELSGDARLHAELVGLAGRLGKDMRKFAKTPRQGVSSKVIKGR